MTIHPDEYSLKGSQYDHSQTGLTEQKEPMCLHDVTPTCTEVFTTLNLVNSCVTIANIVGAIL